MNSGHSEATFSIFPLELPFSSKFQSFSSNCISSPLTKIVLKVDNFIMRKIFNESVEVELFKRVNGSKTGHGTANRTFTEPKLQL